MGKLEKVVAQGRKARGGAVNKGVLHKYKNVTWKQVIEDKEKQILPLNLNIDLRRLT